MDRAPVIGDALMDVVRADRTTDRHPGGSPATTVEQILTRCTQIAAITVVSRPGAGPPTAAELATS